MEPQHPDEILHEELLKPLGLSQNKLAMTLHVPARRINEIVLKKKRCNCRYGFETSQIFQYVSSILARFADCYEPFSLNFGKTHERKETRLFVNLV